MKIYQRPLFVRRLKKLSEVDRNAVVESARRLPDTLGKPHLHSGLGIRPFGKFFEFRVGLQLRVLFILEGGDAHLLTVGDHNEIRAFVKNNS